MLPLSLQTHIDLLIEASGLKSTLVTAREHLTKRYREDQESSRGGFRSSSEAVAYVAARLPATFASIEAVLPHVPLSNISCVLDLGAGPGTAALAAALYWPSCQKFHLVERDAFMSEVSQKLFKDLPEIQHQTFSFQKANILTQTLDSSYDLVFLSYVLNELAAHDQEAILQKAWAATNRGLVILMPGTPAGYRQLMILRDQLIELGAFIAAPCPHHDKCPLKEKDWCHFSTRLQRSSFHREIKNVSLPYEDEKYSYLVVVREPMPRTTARVIRKPLQRSGHVLLDVCTAKGLKRQTISKRDKEAYKKAVKLDWGDGCED
ncbi:MAG: small ribosomal subunit Rsm22 family protein [Candidatus Paracaedibacter sp.]